MMFLLDVNALLALQYPTHMHHARVRLWISQLHAERGEGHVVFATCPITELGFVRIASGKAGLAASVAIAPLMVREAAMHSVWAVPLRMGHAASQ